MNGVNSPGCLFYGCAHNVLNYQNNEKAKDQAIDEHRIMLYKSWTRLK
jgi:hypothetical protein